MLISVEVTKDGKLWRRFQKVFSNLDNKLCGRPVHLLMLIDADTGICTHRVFSDARISYITERTDFDEDLYEHEIAGWCMNYFCKITYQQNYIQYIREP